MRGGPPIQAGTAPMALAGRPRGERKRFLTDADTQARAHAREGAGQAAGRISS